MKKKLLALFIAAVSAVTVFAFAGCTNGNDTGKETEKTQVKKDGKVELEVEKIAFTASNDYMTLKDDTSVKDYLDALKENGEIKYAINDGFITSFYNTESKVISSTANSYEGYDWAFYIDFMTLEGDEAIYATDYTTIEYGGKTLYYSSNGVAGTPCVNGHTYAFVYEYSSFSW